MKKFYEVIYNGAIVRYDLAKQDCYYSTVITKRGDNDERIIDGIVKTRKGCSTRLLVSETINKGIADGVFFTSLDAAINKSDKLWDDFFAPNGKWCVIGVFDNVEVTYRSKPMSKKEAKDELSSCVDSYYTKYSLVKAE